MKLEVTTSRIFMGIYVLLSDIFIQYWFCNESFHFSVFLSIIPEKNGLRGRD